MGALSRDRSTLNFDDFYKWFELGFKVDELDNVEKNLRLRHAARNDAMRTMRAAKSARSKAVLPPSFHSAKSGRSMKHTVRKPEPSRTTCQSAKLQNSSEVP